MEPENNPSDAFKQGALFFHRGHFEAARRCFEEALAEARRSEKAQRTIAALMSLGNTCAALGEREKARALYQEVLTLQRENPDPKAIGPTLVNLGTLCREMGESDRARAYYLEAADLLDQDDFLSLGILYRNMGLLAREAGEMERAVTFFDKAIELHKKTGHEEGLAATWGELGRTYFQLGKDRHAETCFNYSSSHFNRLANPAGEAEALRSLSLIYEARGDIEQAWHCLSAVLNLFRRYGLPPREEDRKRWRDLHPARPPKP